MVIPYTTRWTYNKLSDPATQHAICLVRFASNADNRRCAAMDARDICTVCPKKCPRNMQVNTQYRYDIEEVMVEITNDNLKAKCDTALKGKSEDSSRKWYQWYAWWSTHRFRMIEGNSMHRSLIQWSKWNIVLLIESEKAGGKTCIHEGSQKALEEIRTCYPKLQRKMVKLQE